jgi:hypothetical protein
MKRALTALAAAMAIAASGCGIEDPYEDAEGRNGPAAGDAKPPADTRDPGSLRDPRPPGGEPALRAAVRYALIQGNWSWRTFRIQYEGMRALAAGELLRELAANPPDQDVLLGLERERQTNSARLVAAAATSQDAKDTTVIVVTRERAGARGALDQAPAHRVYRAQVISEGEQAKVAEWQALP